jgi:5'-methylthioadenosine phosphorylase
MTVGLITGSGTYALPGFENAELLSVPTPFGDAAVTRGTLADVDVLHISRHGAGHQRLSNQVTHRANVWALKDLGASAVVGCTACGAVDGTLPLGSLVVFDDLHFLQNRLPDGSLCTFYEEPGDPLRGHWIHADPFSADLRAVLIQACHTVGVPALARGCYGHVYGPRFNTRAEIRSLAMAGVTAVSQTAGPETVLCGEAELPYALLGYATDYANGVKEEATPVSELVRLIGESTSIFARVVSVALPMLAGRNPAPTGTMYRFDG